MISINDKTVFVSHDASFFCQLISEAACKDKILKILSEEAITI